MSVVAETPTGRRTPGNVANAVYGTEALLALVLGLVLVGDKSLSGDEGTTAFWTRGSWGSLTQFIRHIDANAIAYDGFIKVWRALGDSETVLRLPSVLAIAASVIVVAKLAERLFDARTGMVAGAIFATSSLAVEHAQNARSYAFLVLLSALATYAFVVAIERRERLPWIVYTALTVLAIYTHFFAALVLLAQLVSVVALGRDVRGLLRSLGASVLAVGVLCLPILAPIRSTGGHQIDWIERPTLGDIRLTLQAIGGGLARSLVLGAFMVVAVVVLARQYRVHGRGDATWRLALVVSWVMVPIVVTLLVTFSVKHVWLTRYLVIELVPVAILGAYGITRIASWRVVALVTAVVVALGVPSLLDWYRAQTPDFRGAAAAVLARARPGDGIVFCQRWYRQAFEVYVDDHSGTRPHPILPSRPWDDISRALQSDEHPSDVRAEMRAYDRVWLVSNGPLASEDFRDTCTMDARTISHQDFGWIKVRLVDPD